MACALGGKFGVDPRSLAEACANATPPIPTDSWLGKANGFDLTPIGREPGRGWVLLRYGDLTSLDLTKYLTLQFSGTDAAHQYTLQNVTVIGATAATPGWAGDPAAVFVVEVADKRYQLQRGARIDKAYNVRIQDGSAYFANTLNAGVAWAWQDVVTDLATAAGITGFGLPFTPDGTPENFTFWGGSAWDALNDVLDRIACAPHYNPESDSFTVVRLGVTDAAAAALIAVNDIANPPLRTWDAYPVDPVRAWRPEKVRVRFLRYPRPETINGNSPYYTVDIALTATTGVVVGTFVELDDDEAALAQTGAPTNAAALATRAAERAADWLRKRGGFGRPLLKVYRDFIPGVIRTIPGATVGDVFLDDRGGPMQTGIQAKPDKVLENWKPLAKLPPWFPDADIATWCYHEEQLGLSVFGPFAPGGLGTMGYCASFGPFPAGSYAVFASVNGFLRVSNPTGQEGAWLAFRLETSAGIVAGSDARAVAFAQANGNIGSPLNAFGGGSGAIDCVVTLAAPDNIKLIGLQGQNYGGGAITQAIFSNPSLLAIPIDSFSANQCILCGLGSGSGSSPPPPPPPPDACCVDSNPGVFAGNVCFTPSAQTGTCTCWSSAITGTPYVFDGYTGWIFVGQSVCGFGGGYTAFIGCLNGAWAGADNAGGTWTFVSANCGPPLSVVFHVTWASGLCAGSATVTITQGACP